MAAPRLTQCPVDWPAPSVNGMVIKKLVEWPWKYTHKSYFSYTHTRARAFMRGIGTRTVVERMPRLAVVMYTGEW